MRQINILKSARFLRRLLRRMLIREFNKEIDLNVRSVGKDICGKTS